MKTEKILRLLGNKYQNILIHQDDFSDISQDIKAPIYTTDLRYTQGKCDSLTFDPDIVIYCVHSHEPQEKSASIISAYVTKHPVLVIGEKKSVKSLMQQYSFEKRILQGNDAAYLLPIQKSAPATITTTEIEYTKNNVTCTFMTQKGLFSHKKIDAGTDFLLEHIQVKPQQRVLDFACGYGVIGIMLQKTSPIDLTMCDSNTLAIEKTKHNCTLNSVEAVVLTSYLLHGVSDKFNTIVSNPPTHMNAKEVKVFFKQCSAKLTSDGVLWIVINKIIDYQKIAEPYFKKIQEVGVKGRFKVMAFSGPINL